MLLKPHGFYKVFFFLWGWKRYSYLNGKGGGWVFFLPISSLQVFQFPAGIFEIDEQFLVPAGISILGADKPNDMAEPTKTPDWKTQTLFLATKGATLAGLKLKAFGYQSLFVDVWSF